MRLISMILIFATVTTTAPVIKADEAQCRAVLHLCDSALTMQRNSNNLQQQIIADQDARFKEVQKEVQSASLWKPIAIGGITAALLEALIIVIRK